MPDAAKSEAPYSFKFDNARDKWVCSIHGEQPRAVWMPCWAGCDGGFVDDSEDDPINATPGEMSPCGTCAGNGGWRVCPECNADNPDVEW